MRRTLVLLSPVSRAHCVADFRGDVVNLSKTIAEEAGLVAVRGLTDLLLCTRVTISRLCDKFDTHCTICYVHRRRSVRPLTATRPASSSIVLKRFTTSPRKSATQCARETGDSSKRVRRILKAFKWKLYIPRILHAINEDDPDRGMLFCEWFQQMVNEDEEFVTKNVWSDEAKFKLN